jgi:hypothetical protein
MADTQKYVKVTFDFGTDVDGVLTSKNPGEVSWLSMPRDEAVIFENYAIIPALVMMMERAGELGMETSGLNLPGIPNKPNK